MKKGYEAVVAGGAVARWVSDEAASDLDIVVLNKEPTNVKVQDVEGIFGACLVEKFPPQNNNAPYVLFEFYVDGVEIQLSVGKAKNINSLFDEYPLSICEVVFDVHGNYTLSKSFVDTWVSKNILIKDGVKLDPNFYDKKVREYSVERGWNFKRQIVN